MSLEPRIPTPLGPGVSIDTLFIARKDMALTYPDDLKYLDTHEYIRLEGDLATIGITAFAVNQLGDIVFLDLPEVGAGLEKGEAFGTVESVKAVEDLKAPVTVLL